jgi:enoyl-CoA hydratase
MRDYNHLDVSLEGDVLRIAFDRPKKANAIDEGTHEELTHVFEDAHYADARIVLLTGNGDSFSAGGDLEWLQTNAQNPEQFRRTMYDDEKILRDILMLEKPVVVRVNGACTGLGATIALFCDILIATDDAKIGDPHVNAGLVAGDGGAVVWPLLMSMSKAKELLMTGDLVSGEEAVDLGLVNYAVPEDELDDKVDEMIEKLATGPQPSIQYTKKALNSWLQLGMNTAFDKGQAWEVITQSHPDHQEAVDAFVEGRRPDFPTGRDADE